MTHETPTPETISSPTLEDNLNLYQDRLARLEAEADGIAATNYYPEWYYEDNDRMRGMIPQLKDEGADLSNVSRYFDLYSKELSLRSIVSGNPPYIRPLQAVEGNLGANVLGRAFQAEPITGPLHTAILADLKEEIKTPSGSLTPELGILRVGYGVETATDLLGIGGNEYSDELRKVLLNEKPIRWIRFTDEENPYRGDAPDMPAKERLAQHQIAMRTWMSKGVEAATGMPADEAMDYVFAASRNAFEGDDRFLSIITNIEYFGIDRIRELSKATGIHGLEAYSVEQLERMEEFVHDPSAVAERLADHDVIAVMINRFGDYNGVLRNVAADFDDDTKRVLFFEVTRMPDIYRRMSALHKAGIMPSTVVLAAHSSPGQFAVSDRREKSVESQRSDLAVISGRKFVAMANGSDELEPGVHGYSMHGMTGMARLIEEYMQPSQAIDDSDDDFGREKVIFQACHGASEAKVGDLDESGEKVQIGMESIISQLGKDLLASGVKTNVDIYGAAEGIQMQRNGHGVHYTGQPGSVGKAMMGRPQIAAERVRVEHGKLTKQEVHDIALRKAT
jgi:hypothetical protein